MAVALQRLGEVVVVAPLTEHSGVSHKITFLTPLTVRKVYVGEPQWGWAVEGSPADCVKIAITEICKDRKPDLVVSGINGGLNAGINVIYSGTVAAAVEAAFFGITSMAVSLEMVESEPFEAAAGIALGLIEKLLEKKSGQTEIFNINIPFAAINAESPTVRSVPMDTTQYWEMFERRHDPFGRTYFWLSGRPKPWEHKTTGRQPNTDIEALAKGDIAITPLSFDMSNYETMREMAGWDIQLGESGKPPEQPACTGPAIRTKYWSQD